MSNTNVLPDRWTVEDVEFLLEQVETKQVLVADSKLGLPTIHDFSGARHLGMGVFIHETSDHTILFDAGTQMERTPSGQGWTSVRVEEGEFPYDFEGVRATLQGYLDNGHTDGIEDETDPTGFIAGEGDAYDYVPAWMKVPKLYTAEKQDDPLAILRWFTPDSSWTWYVLEYDGEDTCFGLVDGFETELGYFSLAEMREVTGPHGMRIERDLWFKPTPITQVPEYERKWGRYGGPYKGTPASVEAEPEPKPVAEPPKPAPRSKREIERESKQITRRLKEINGRMDIAYDVAINDPQSLQKLEAERAALFQRKRELTEELRALLQPEAPPEPDEDEPPAWTVTQRLYQERKSLAVAGGVPILNVADAREHERLVREAVARGELAHPYMLLKDYPDLLEADVLYVEDVYGTTYQISRYDYERGANQIRIYAEKDGSLTFRSLLPDDDPRRKDGETLHRDNIAKVLTASEPSDDGEDQEETDLAAGEDTPPAWQMTRQEFRQYRADQLKAVGRDHAEPFETLRLHPSGSGEQVGEHQLFVEEALAEGKPVPTQVLADYPDLWQPWTWTLEQWLKLEHRYQRSGTDMYYIPPIGKRVLWPGTTSKKAVARQQHKLEVQQALYQAKNVSDEVLADYPDLIEQDNPDEGQVETWVRAVNATAEAVDRSNNPEDIASGDHERLCAGYELLAQAGPEQMGELEALRAEGATVAEAEAALSDDGPTADPTICDNAYKNAFGRDRESVAKIPMCQNNPVERVVTIYDDGADPKDGVVVRLCTECYTWLREDARLSGYRIRSKRFEPDQAEPAEAEPVATTVEEAPVEDWEPDDQDLAEFDQWELHLLTGMLGKKSSAFYKALRQVKRPGTLRLALQSANGSQKRRNLIEKCLAELEAGDGQADES